jgi:HEAT repeat protein
VVTLREAIDALERRDLGALLDLLTAIDRTTRIGAALRLGELGDPAAVEPLGRCLHAGDELLRNAALKALAEIGDDRALPLVYESATTDESWGTRSTAAEALVRLGDSRAVAVLSELLVSPQNPWPQSSRKWLAKLAVECGLTEVTPLLTTLKIGARPPARWRLNWAIRALSRAP